SSIEVVSSRCSPLMRAARSPDRTQTTAGAISHRRPDRTYSTPSWCDPDRRPSARPIRRSVLRGPALYGAPRRTDRHCGCAASRRSGIPRARDSGARVLGQLLPRPGECDLAVEGRLVSLHGAIRSLGRSGRGVMGGGSVGFVVQRPSGVVTFLFTDIEGSTRRWESDPDAMRGALAAHDEVLRNAIEGRGGWLFKNTGDGVCAAFGSPHAAVEAA